jgi:Uma2 family endonuclease
MTFEEAARLDPERESGELDAGRWVPIPRGTWRHGEIVANVCGVLGLHAKSHREWSVATADPGTKLGSDPAILRGPDVGVVRASRAPKGNGSDGWLDGAPDLAVEVRSDSQGMTELSRKALEYMRAGAKIVWVIDPEPQHVMVFTPPDHVRVLTNEDSLDAGDLLPGFRCNVSELFE